MKVPNWMKSKARKAREAAEAERARQEAAASYEEIRRKYEAELAAANTPEKLKETGTAMLIELIQTYPYVQVMDNMYLGKKWRFGNIEFNSFYCNVEYREGLKSTTLFCVPTMQREAVYKALDVRYRQLGDRNHIPVTANTPVAAEIQQLEKDVKKRVAGLPKNEATKQEEMELMRRKRDVFMRLARETLEKAK